MANDELRELEKYSKTIRRRAQTLLRKEVELEHRWGELQGACPHYNLRYKCDGSSGGWDNTSYYWIGFRCPDCRKQWQEEHVSGLEAEMQRQYPNIFKVDRYQDTKRYNDFYNDILFHPFYTGR